jgi:hypothetical protein
MKRPVLVVALFCILLACDRNPDPTNELLQEYNFSYKTAHGIKTFSGEWVDDSIGYMIVNRRNQNEDPVRVFFEIAKGGGELTVKSGYTDSSGLIYTGWKLGSESFDQILRAKSYDEEGNFLTSSDLVAYGFRLNQWDAYSGSSEGAIKELVSDTVNKITLMVTNNRIFRQGDRYFLWDEITDSKLSSVRTIDMGPDGTIYVSKWNGELVKSTDHGVSWQFCTKPFPDRPYYFYLSVSNDNYVWAYYFDYPTKFSKDGGLTWTDAGSGLSSKGFGDVFRLKDGSLLFHGSNCCSLNRSFDNGLSWTPIVTPGYSVKLFVNEKEEIYIITQENGLIIYKSADYGTTFTRIYSTSPQWGTSLENTFSKWKNFYYIVIPGYGILKSPDLVNYEIYWLNSDLIGLFIDHNGVLIATDHDNRTVYYRKNTD